jgi:hypothetical protein
MTAHDDALGAMRDRLYAALKHEKSCVCGACSHGLNTVDDLVARCKQAERERDEALEDVKTMHHSCARYRVVIDGLEARVAQLEGALRSAHSEAHRWWGRTHMDAGFYRNGLEAVDALLRAALDAARPADVHGPTCTCDRCHYEACPACRPADTKEGENLTVWWWTDGLGVDYDIPVPYAQTLPHASALTLGHNLSQQKNVVWVKVFGASELDERWRWDRPADGPCDCGCPSEVYDGHCCEDYTPGKLADTTEEAT